jgi:hypothetical protein
MEPILGCGSSLSVLFLLKDEALTAKWELSVGCRGLTWIHGCELPVGSHLLLRKNSWMRAGGYICWSNYFSYSLVPNLPAFSTWHTWRPVPLTPKTSELLRVSIFSNPTSSTILTSLLLCVSHSLRRTCQHHTSSAFRLLKCWRPFSVLLDSCHL